MKKYGLYLVIFLFTGVLFARDFSFWAVETDDNSVTECYGESISTITTKDDVEISVSMVRCNEDDYYRVCVDIKNLGNEPFNFSDKCIFAYEGNYDENEWNKMDYLPARDFYEKAKHDATVKTVLAAVSLGLAAIDSGLAPDHFDLPPIVPVPVPSPIGVKKSRNGSRLYKASRSSRHDGDPIWVGLGLMNLFGTLDENEDTLEFLDNHLLFSETIGPDEGYSGIFYLPTDKGPDFKICMQISKDEEIEYYFSRSDRERVLHPFMDTDDNQYAIIFYGGSGNDFYPNTGVDFGFFNKNLGGYFGFGFGYQNGYRYERYALNFDAGLSEKCCPHLWLLFGLGCSAYNETNENDFDYEAEDVYFNIGPEVGLNFIYGFLDFGGKVRYKIHGPLEVELMFGFAF